jgi:ABC-type sugar transport system substrate-binding protein
VSDNEPTRGAGTDRRTFIKGLGVAVGSGVVLGPSVMGCADASIGTTVKAGMLVPDSTRVDGYFDQYTSGAYLGFSEHATTPAEAVIDVLDSRGAPRIEQVRSFISDHNLDILLLVANPNAVGDLVAPIERLGCPAIVLDVGFSAPDERVRTSNWIFSNTLGGWESNWLTGWRVARNAGPRGHVISSMYDASHDGILAFQAGFDAGGGRSVRLWIPDSPAMPYSTDDAIRQIAVDGGDFVFIQAGATETQDVASKLDARLGATAMSVTSSESCLFDGEATAMAGLEATTSWHPDAINVENEVFVRRFNAVTGRTPTPLAVLGFEAASWVGEATRQLKRGADRAALRQAIADVSFDGPRGAMVPTPTGRLSHRFQHVRLTTSGHEVLSRAELPRDVDARLASVLPEVRSGSTNAYLAV